jgi:acyl-CoA reductase-like NAD-dependent aldehyde dehydrogenase
VRYGVAAGVWTTDVRRAHRVAAQLAAGTVWVNTYGMFDVAAPYGGYKMSGHGRECGQESLDAYLQTKAVWVNLE